MNRKRIPGTDFDVSPVCLGTMTFGNPVERVDAIRIVHWALDHDINFFDTADMYEGYDRTMGSSGGVAETILGQALKDRRDQAVVTTKVGCAVGSSEYTGQGLSRTHILHQIDASLARLQTDYIDVYELHRPDPDTPLGESLAVMAELITAGKVRHWGVSNFSGQQIKDIVRLCDSRGWPRPVISQPPLSWLKRDEQTNSLPVCREFNIAVTPYQPLQGGLLTGKYRRGQPLPTASRAAQSDWLNQPDDSLFDQLEQFEQEAHDHQLQPAQFAIRWLMDQPEVTSVVVGTTQIEQLGVLFGAWETSSR
ncbi:MAG TPA: aldo/keto reductase [Planctomycetes bacterium]|nr:aldo/keto reductase [Planctomycetota bacterium]